MLTPDWNPAALLRGGSGAKTMHDLPSHDPATLARMYAEFEKRDRIFIPPSWPQTAT